MVAFKKRAKLTALIVITILAVLLIISVAFSEKPKDSNILARYVIGPAISLSQCESCHSNIDTFKTKSLKFTHWAHFKNGVSCTTCHVEPAHLKGKTVLPPMESCFSCHGLKHSSQGLSASGSCDTCHPSNFNKLPKDHSAAFIANDHKDINRLQLNRCMICHKKSDCKSCHDKKKVKSNYSNYFFDGRLEPKLQPELQIIDFEKLTTLSQCTTCHTDLNANAPAGLIFDHWVHFKNGVKCDTCHQGLVHSKGAVTRQSMNFCYSCHGTKHSTQGLVATEDCRGCHTASFNLKPPSHAPNWVKIHKKNIDEELFSCLTCHQKDFCANCHTARKVIPHANYRNPEQQNQIDVKKAHKEKRDCKLCHTDKFCTKCHKSAMPHPYTWLGDHRLVLKKNKSEERDCWTCHQEKPFCQSCHHAAKAAVLYSKHYKSNLMNQQNCVKCHEDLKKRTNQLVKEGKRALVYHKVHFRKNYTCEECHLPGLQRLKNETFELCKIEGCHPAGQKKPISGTKLCMSCHKGPHQKTDSR